MDMASMKKLELESGLGTTVDLGQEVPSQKEHVHAMRFRLSALKADSDHSSGLSS